jgi:hypothetical protein
MRLLGLMTGLFVLSCALAAEEREVIAIIAPALQAGKAPDTADLGLIYRRKKMLWPDGVRIQPTNLPPDHPLRRQFSQRVLGKTPEALASYWNNQYYHGITPPRVFASEEAILRFVAETPGAIGYVQACKPDSRVRVLFWIFPDGSLSQQPPVCD